MIAELPQTLVLMTVGAFLLGWILASISAKLGSGPRSRQRDPRDDRIRSLEADLRVANTKNGQATEKFTALESEFAEFRGDLEKRDRVITDQAERIECLQRELKESVIKTRELRHELTDRVTENVRSEVKLREVETELSIAQASTDLIATGVLDYTVDDDDRDSPDENARGPAASGKVSTTAT